MLILCTRHGAVSMSMLAWRASWLPGPDAPSKLRTAGPHRDHLGATNHEIAADNSGHYRAGISPAPGADSGMHRRSLRLSRAP
jgi:hypothetical protein